MGKPLELVMGQNENDHIHRTLAPAQQNKNKTHNVLLLRKLYSTCIYTCSCKSTNINV
jgi:hypothetical protein